MARVRAVTERPTRWRRPQHNRRALTNGEGGREYDATRQAQEKAVAAIFTNDHMLLFLTP
jgi:hypothetical protein